MSVLILAEHDGKQIKTSTRQAIGAAQFWQQDITLLLVGDQLQSVIEAAQQLAGVSNVLVAEAPHFAKPLAEDIAPLLVALGKQHNVILAAHTAFAKNSLPRAAALLDVAMISDVLEIQANNTYVRPIYAGNLLATVQSSDTVQVLTIRGSRFKAIANRSEGTASVQRLELPAANTSARWISEAHNHSTRPELSNARVVVSGGRSLGSAERFNAVLDPLAQKLTAAIGATRAAVDAGYAPNELQVGQTGTIVAPDLYIALGISGAVQHTAGMKDSKVIVAVNLDPDAAIFQIADYALVADLFEVAPALTAALS